MRKTYSAGLFWAILALLSTVQAQITKYHRISVSISPQELEYLFNNGLEIDHFSYENKKDFTDEVSDQDVALFRRNGLKVTYLIRDLEKNYRAINEEIDQKAARNKSTARAAAVATPTNFSLGSYAGYYSFAELPAILDQMRAKFPSLITVESTIGNSFGGRPLYMVKISDNADVDENEPELLLNALHHAREPMSLSQLVFFMWHMLENYNTDKEIRTLLNSSEIYILPCLNPDGYVHNQTINPIGTATDGFWPASSRIVPLCNTIIEMNRKMLRISTFYGSSRPHPVRFRSRWRPTHQPARCSRLS